MSRLPSVLWATFAACWVFPIQQLCQMIGGCQWIEHLGYSGAASTAAVMIVLCALAAYSTLRGTLPPLLRYGLITVSTLHLLNAAWLFYFFAVGGRVSRLLYMPFLLLKTVFPSILVTAQPTIAVALYVVLPLACLVLALRARRLPATTAAHPAWTGVSGLDQGNVR
jgi:hypothetical protein